MWIIIDYMFELNTKIQAKYHKITNKLLEKKRCETKNIKMRKCLQIAAFYALSVCGFGKDDI